MAEIEKLGIDISMAQGSVDWETLKKNEDLAFVIIRASQGIAQDSRFAYNITECRRVGIPYGLYFASSAKSVAEAKAEAEFAIGYGRLYSPTFGMWFDLELDSQRQLGKVTVSAMIRAWLETVSVAGLRCGVYTNKTWLDTAIEHDIIEDYDLWYAAYPSTAKKTLTQAPPDNQSKLSYPMAKIGQWSRKGKLDGIIGDVDLNVSYVEDLKPKKPSNLGYVTIEEAKKILSGMGYQGIIL